MVPNAFQNQVVIITGASAGIGAALAEELANQGARLVIAARREDRLEEVAKKCRALGSEVMIVPTDVSDEAQMDKNGISRGANGRKIYHKRMMTAKRCAEITLIAAYKRKREILMGPGILTVWLKLLSPALLDWLAIKIFLEPAIRRARKNN